MKIHFVEVKSHWLHLNKLKSFHDITFQYSYISDFYYMPSLGRKEGKERAYWGRELYKWKFDSKEKQWHCNYSNIYNINYDIGWDIIISRLFWLISWVVSSFTSFVIKSTNISWVYTISRAGVILYKI